MVNNSFHQDVLDLIDKGWILKSEGYTIFDAYLEDPVSGRILRAIKAYNAQKNREEKLVGYYSAQHNIWNGSIKYVNENFEEVTVTCVLREGEESCYMWPDKVCVGPVLYSVDGSSTIRTLGGYI